MIYIYTQISPTSETCSAYPSTFQPFSARNYRRENLLLGKRTFPKFFAFFAFFVTFFFLFLSRFFIFRCFAFFRLRVRVLLILLVYVFGFLSFSYPQKLVFNRFFPFLVVFFSFGFSLQVTRENKATQAAAVVVAAPPQPTAIIQQSYQQQQEARACVFL